MSPRFENNYSPNELHNLQKRTDANTYHTQFPHKEIVLPPQANNVNNGSTTTSTTTTTKGSLQVPSHH
jgi:hypothetical protein